MENNENELNEFLDSQENYTLPERKDVVVDLTNQKTLDLSSLTPIEMIRLTAKENGIELKEFKMKYGRFDTGCRRSGCYGRGYKGWDGNLPVPCVCLFKPEHRDDGKNVINRKIKRNFAKIAQMESRAFIKKRAEQYGLIHSHKDIWTSKNGAEFKLSNIKGKWDFRRFDPSAKVIPIEQFDEETDA